MSTRATSLQATNVLAINREIDSKYDAVLAVRDKLVEIEKVAGLDIEQLLTDLQDAQDFTGINVVAGETAGWNATTKTITVPTLKGDQGEQGLVGATGATGPQGPIGPRGLTGAAGLNGTNGKDGTNGADGIDGLDGVDGKDLTVEQISYDGNTGKFIWQFSDGTSYKTPDLRGPKGSTGDKGDKGDTGLGVHHIKGTSTTNPIGDFGVSPFRDTYTVYGDANETINLGYFAVANGVSDSMGASVYDPNGNGIVDNSERLGGELPEHYVDIVNDQGIGGNKSFAGNVTIQGNLVVNGDSITVNTTTVEVEDNLVLINKGEVGNGVTKGEAGILVDRGTATDYKFVWEEAGQAFKIGEVGNLQKVATIEDIPIANGLAVWNNAASRFDTTLDPSVDTITIGGSAISWNIDENTLDVMLNGATLQVGQEQLVRVRNNSGIAITNGTAVMATGTIGNSGRITIAKANLTQANARYVLGIVTETIADGADGFCTVFGKVRGIQTNGANYGETWVDGDILYIKDSGNGALTKVVPADTQVKLPVAIVVNAHVTNGTIFVRVNSVDENASKVELASKVDKNISIVGATHTKITYDVKGLVTGGTDLVATDIPNLDWSKITTGKPTTVSGYGITDAYTKTESTANFEPKNTNIQSHIASISNPHSVTKAQVGLGNVDNTADSAKNVLSATKWTTARTLSLTGAVTGSVSVDGSGNVSLVTSHTADPVITLTGDVSGSATMTNLDSVSIAVVVADDSHNHIIGNVDGLDAALNARIPLTQKGIANGVATLDANGLVPVTQLPSFVDDVLEFTDLAAFPATGETGKIYVDLSTNKTYRWSGSTYVYITSGAVDSVAGKTGVVTLVKGDVGLGSVDNTADTTKNVLSATKLTTARTIGGVSFDGTANINLPGVNTTGNQNTTGSAATLTTTRTISLSGDATGSVSFNGSANVTIPVVIADDSHNHIISNVDGLQTALDGKQPLSTVLTNTTASFTTADETKLDGIESGATADQTAAEILTAIKTVDGSGSGLDADLLDGQQGYYYQAASTAITTSNIGSQSVTSATKLTTARTISLTGDVTGSVSFDGSANASMTATIAANSVALGTDTTGNYVAGITAGTGITVSGTAGEGWSPTITNSAPNVTTNITTTHAASTVTVNSSDGTNGTISAATTSLAGVMTATDKTKLDSYPSDYTTIIEW